MLQQASASSPVSMSELVSLCAVDYQLFCRSFFPKTFRDPFPKFADKIWQPLESPKARYVNLQLFRGSGKTTTLRVFLAKRIAYADSRTILYLGESKPKARQTIRWLKAAITKNIRFAETFGLSQGNTWNDDEIEIIHSVAGHSIWVSGLGITGPVRGMLHDDYRPDLIVIDDVLNDENSATVEQRDKLENLILGAVAKSLAPRTEAPNSKMVFLQTPFHEEDASMKALKDPMWYSTRQGCWTVETEDAPNGYQESAWEERFPTQELREDKNGYIARNKSSVFAREMEVKLVTPETSAFLGQWIRTWEELPKKGMFVCIAVDPVPPPTEQKVQKGLHRNDFECIAAVGYCEGKYYLLEYQMNRGHEPTWTIATFFSMAKRWRARKLVVETHQYQATLYWLFQQAMIRQRYFIPIEENRDKRSKYDKITDTLEALFQHGQFYIGQGHAEFRDQFTKYPNVSHDDVLDAVAMATRGCITMEMDEEGLAVDDDNVIDIEYEGGCP